MGQRVAQGELRQSNLCGLGRQQESNQLVLPGAAGKLRCQACGKVLANHAILAQHLKDKHQGHNRPDAPSSAVASQQQPPGRGLHFFGDVLAASMASRQQQQAQPGTSVGGLPARGPRGPPSVPRNLKELREYLKVGLPCPSHRCSRS